MHAHNPVSYTHLDVYKRQVLRSSFCCLIKWVCQRVSLFFFIVFFNDITNYFAAFTVNNETSFSFFDDITQLSKKY